VKPICWYHRASGRIRFDGTNLSSSWIPLYAKQEWEGLDEVEIDGMTCDCVDDGTFTMDCAREFARAIEAKLKEKNT
jgi:hypothetical protein